MAATVSTGDSTVDEDDSVDQLGLAFRRSGFVATVKFALVEAGAAE